MNGGRRATHRMLAIDLGAESGRGIVGAFDGERLKLEEVHRFANEPVMLGDTLVWDFPRLYHESLAAIRQAVAGGPLMTIGVDGWGVDFGLLDERDRLMAMPVHYRDARTDGLLEVAHAQVPREQIYAATGVQSMQVNTLYQLMALVRDRDPILDEARTLLMIPDLVLHFLTGSAVTEFTNATTTGCYDVPNRDWARPLLTRLGVPDGILPPVIASGTVLAHMLPDVADDVGAARARVVAPATHDTASAVAGIPLEPSGSTAFLSSGTWSLLGLEVDQPILTPSALQANVTNEGGLGGRTLLIKSLTGMWLLQGCRRALARAGLDIDHATLAALAARSPARTAFVDPDDARFFRPTDLPRAVRAACRETGQPVPTDAGTMIRILLESLALKYAWTIHMLESVSGRSIEGIHIVGGGARNELLCQLTSDAAGIPVRAGPIEAAAIGNLLAQAMATGRLASLAEARDLVARSFGVRTYEPTGDWSEARERFAQLLMPIEGAGTRG